MKHLKMLTVSLAVIALAVLVAAGSSAATTLEVGGATKTEAVEITASLKSGSSASLKDTFGFSMQTCASSELKGATSSPFTGATVTMPISTLSWSNCGNPVSVHKAGTLHISHIAGTTNGTVISSGAEWTMGSPFGTVNCVTGAGTHLGTLTGTKEGHATIDINAQLSCSGISSRWQATYTVTSPTGLGVADEPDPPSTSTFLEVGGGTKTEAVEIAASLQSGTSASLKDTSGFSINTCSGSELSADSESPFSGATVTAVADSLSFTGCTSEVWVDKAGTVHVEHIPGTTNGTVSWSGAEVTTKGPLGTLNCKTEGGTHLGTLTGTKEGHATIDVNAVLHCSGVSSRWQATYTVTSPTGLGVSDKPDQPSTILEVGGATKTEAVEIAASLKSGTSTSLKDTFGFSMNTCTTSEVKGATSSPFTGTTVTMPISTLSWSNCGNPVSVHKAGTLHISHIAGTTNGTVSSSGAEVTTGSPFGTLNCQTGTGTHLGTLTGTKEGHATMHVNAVLSCSGISSRWSGTYTVTSPTGLGVAA